MCMYVADTDQSINQFSIDSIKEGKKVSEYRRERRNCRQTHTEFDGRSMSHELSV